MKKIILQILTISFTATIYFLSCRKERSCEGYREGNKSPIAIAGFDQVITLPTDSVLLDGSSSSEADGMTGECLWTKISGPASFNINNAAEIKLISQ